MCRVSPRIDPTVYFIASSQSNKEWKPKSSKKQSTGPGVIGTPAKFASPPAKTSKTLEVQSSQLQDNLSRVNISENQNVIIAPHIRVSTTERYRVTFGSMGTEFEPSINPGLEDIKDAAESYINPTSRFNLQTLTLLLFAHTEFFVSSGFM